MPSREILRLDRHGQPQKWITKNEAATYYATDSVAWTLGDTFAALRGGLNSMTGQISRIEVHPIIAVRGVAKVNLFDACPALTKRTLVARDRNTCGFCGGVFKYDDLTCDHIVPQSKGGLTKWENCICCCKKCNGAKADMSCEEANMPLLFAPYRPSHAEHLILSGRNIRADVHAFLAARLPKGSRLL
ncbi:HNH endonuclease [Rhodoferax antarcticus]|uniref:HNH endonuclease family protein n=1 Tax=Rhodoferax antarcticus ANT.BR TaxID=1111071 RepID=A0A1Q8Y9Q6_9BURK|nr:HNH endonuclease [Rhodoferax antarcticus]OLP04610.1 HNH endonuclease family protein [Rhodoferax antarcticus ANT.BR]